MCETSIHLHLLCTNTRIQYTGSYNITPDITLNDIDITTHERESLGLKLDDYSRNNSEQRKCFCGNQLQYIANGHVLHEY